MQDDRLRLIFICCHPSLTRGAQVELTLRLLGGLSTPQASRTIVDELPLDSYYICHAVRAARDGSTPHGRVGFQSPSSENRPRPEFGGPERLEPAELPEPVAGAGEVVIGTELASITFVETQIRAGRPLHPAMAPELPAVLGNGVGGVVAAVGEGVATAVIGRRVVSALRGTGGYAERAVALADALIDVPDDLPLRDSVALLADGRIALRVLRGAQLQPGETALVMAAGGGVGSLAREALELAVAGRLRPTIGQTFLLARASGAHAAIGARETLGKTLLVVP